MNPPATGRVADQVAIVTGGASGIGEACVRRLAREGAHVIVADLKVDAARTLASELGVGVHEYGVDVTDETAVAAMVSAVVADYGQLDILITCAALTDPAHQAADVALGELSTDVWDRTLSVDLLGTMLCCKHAVRAMSPRGRGSIVTISSNSALAGDLGLSSYACAKAGVNALTMSIATAYGKAGIRANVVSPGSIAGPSLRRNVPPAVVGMLEGNCLLPRLGTPDDVAAAVLFLVSDDAGFVTGQLLRVDGGTLSQLPHVPAMRAGGFTNTAGAASTPVTTSSTLADGAPR